jgi:hypothetical protein
MDGLPEARGGGVQSLLGGAPRSRVCTANVVVMAELRHLARVPAAWAQERRSGPAAWPWERRWDCGRASGFFRAPKRWRKVEEGQ